MSENGKDEMSLETEYATIDADALRRNAGRGSRPLPARRASRRT